MVSKADLDLAHSLRTFIVHMRRRLRKEVSIPGTVSIAEENVLRTLIEETTLSPSQLCSKLNLSSQFMSQILNSLQDEGYITRRPSKEDKRKNLVSISVTGQLKIDEARKKRDEWLASAISSQFTVQQKKTIKKAIELLSALPDL